MSLPAQSVSHNEMAGLTIVEDVVDSTARLSQAHSFVALAPSAFPYDALIDILSMSAAMIAALRAFSFAIYTHPQIIIII